MDENVTNLTWYPFNVMYKHYKKTELFKRFGVSKDTIEEFQYGMEQIANENGIMTTEGVDFQFFKKKGKDEYVIGDRSKKTTIIAYSSEWIHKCIVDVSVT